jgi:threonylcarbamoyladenosine tRNA methylthiotransferase MtaB
VTDVGIEPLIPARPVRVAFKSFGCKLNLYEASGMGQDARARGFIVSGADEDGDADVVVVNTCSVTLRADREARQYVRAVHRRNPSVRTVITGCYAQRAPEELATLPGVALVAGHAEKDRLAALLTELPSPDSPARIEVGDIAEKPLSTLRATGVEGRTRALLRVQDGCDAACSYCVIPQTRGRSHSLPFEEAVEEGHRLVREGFREIVLTGTHLGHFGIDLPTRQRRLSDLVEAIVSLPGSEEFRLRISSLEPQEIDDKLVDLLAGSDRIAPHLHLPLQSGSDRLLRAMRRSYRTGNYHRQVTRVVKRLPRLALGADLILGFPGETEQDFRDTLTFLGDLPFTHLHPFTYSPRPNTLAAGWPGRPPRGMSRRRLTQAGALVAHGNRIFREGHLGDTVRVLVEEVDEAGLAHGLSGTYLRVRFPAGGVRQGAFSLVRVTGITHHGLEGVALRSSEEPA